MFMTKINEKKVYTMTDDVFNNINKNALMRLKTNSTKCR